jgi:hypothetical protein
LKVSKSRRRSGPSIWKDTWQSSSDIGGSPDRRLHRHIGNRDIGDPEHKGFVHRRITIRDFPIRSRSVGPHRVSGGQVAKNRHRRHFVHRDIGDSGDMMFRHFEFVIRETPISGGQLSA